MFSNKTPISKPNLDFSYSFKDWLNLNLFIRKFICTQFTDLSCKSIAKCKVHAVANSITKNTRQLKII